MMWETCESCGCSIWVEEGIGNDWCLFYCQECIEENKTVGEKIVERVKNLKQLDKERTDV